MDDKAGPTSGVAGYATLYFFFSYARQDLRGDLPEDREDLWLRKDLRKNPYLGRFFYDLVEAVKSESGQAEVSFRDLDDIRLSDRWRDHLAQALQTARVLVAIYSARYFGRPYCGKEVQIFLDRRRSLGGGNVEKIAPVLWSSKKSLVRYKLPPPALAHIQYEDNDFPPEYRTIGLQSMMMRSRRGLYRRFVDTLAQRIIELAEVDPLPPLPTPPNLDEIRSAFEVESQATVEVPPGPHLVQFLLFGESLPAASGTEAKDRTSWRWQPFNTDPREIRELTSLEHLDLFEKHQRGATIPDLLGFIQELRNNNTLCIAIFDSLFLEQSDGAAVLSSLLDERGIDCGIFLIYDEEANGAALVRARLEAWQLRRGNQLLEIAGSGIALREGLTRVVLSLQQRIMDTGPIYRTVAGEGPLESPLLQGPKG